MTNPNKIKKGVCAACRLDVYFWKATTDGEYKKYDSPSYQRIHECTFQYNKIAKGDSF
jgi:hypothetical protein